jgi:single-strand DNA-binding protein
MQKITIIGHLGNDAQIRDLGEDTVINFAVAHNSTFVDKEHGELIKKTQWFSCAYWQNSEVYKLLKTGTQVYVEGEISAGTYINKKGLVEVDLKVRVSKLYLLGKPQQEPLNDTAPDEHAPANEPVTPTPQKTKKSLQVPENESDEQPF